MPKPYLPNDSWSRKAKEQGYRARSVFKLMELDERFKLLKPGMVVLDLGAAPGSWLQYTVEKIGPKGKAIGIDLQKIHPISAHVQTYEQDITNVKAIADILAQEDREYVDLILSDLAPNTSGIKDVDQWKSVELDRAVVAIAAAHLKPGSRCVLKVLRGADFDEFYRELKKSGWKVQMEKPKASRDRSKEVYLVLRKPPQGEEDDGGVANMLPFHP